MDISDRIFNALEGVFDELTEAVKGALKESSEKVVSDAKANMRPYSKTGLLLRSITSEVDADGSGDIVAKIGTNVGYAAYVELGTGPVGNASPKDLPPGVSPTYRGSAWVYRDPETGKFRRTSGRPATQFLYPALKANEDAIRDNVQRAVKKVLKGD